MKRLAPLFLPLALVACTPTQVIVYDKPGVSVSRFSSDYASCLARGEREAPVIFQNQTNVGTAIGVGVGIGSCGGWSCGNSTGLGVSVDTRRVDINAGRRIGVMQQCMSGLGYTPKQIQRCSADVRRQTVIAEGFTQAPITQQSCAAELQGIGPLILTP
jgi:hypothetical protein